MAESVSASEKSTSLGRQKAALSLAFIIIALVSVLAFATIQRLVAASQRVEQTQGMLVELNLFLSDLKDVESSARGYFVTGDDRYLKTHSSAAEKAGQAASRLRSLGNGKLRPQLRSLLALSDQRISHSLGLIAQHGSAKAAEDLLAPGADIMDRIRREASAIAAEQARQYQAERAALERQAWIASLALVAGIIS